MFDISLKQREMQKNNIKEAQSHIFCQDKNIFEHITVDEE